MLAEMKPPHILCGSLAFCYRSACTLVFGGVSVTLYPSFRMKCCSLEIGPAPLSPPVLEEDSVQFSKLSYLGCTWVKAPRNEGEAQRAMATLRAESAIPIPITLHVPSGPDGSVRSGTHQDVKQLMSYKNVLVNCK